jgi:Tfp pilus assembly protein PilN
VSQQINLYQPIFRRQKKKFSAVAMVQAAALVIGGIVVMAAYSEWQIGRLRAELKQAEQQQAVASKRLAEVIQKFGVQPVSRTVDEEIARLEQEIAARERVQEVLRRGIFSNPQGFSGYLVALARQHEPGVWLTGFDIVGAAEQVSLSGRSTRPELVPRFVQKLAREERMAGVEFHLFQMSRPEERPRAPYVEFVLRTGKEAAP